MALVYEVVSANGYQAVLGFYHQINEDTVLTNHDERLAVADWGFASYNTFNMFTHGRHVAAMGMNVPDLDPEGCYRIHQPIGMFWTYTPDALLIGEEVFDLAPPVVERIDPAEMPTWDEVREAVKPYLPPAELRVKEMAV